MSFRVMAVIVAVIWCAAGARSHLSAATPVQTGTAPSARTPDNGSSTVPSTAAEYKAVVDKYCVTCHNDRTKTAGLSLQNLDFANLPAHADKLEKVSRKLLLRAMPPLGMPRPSQDVLDGMRRNIEAALNSAAEEKPDPGRALLRRLNRTEYANAISDLLDLHVDMASVLPPDDSGHGFDNIADVLNVTPVLMERYLTAARQVSALAVGDSAEILAGARTYTAEADLAQNQHIQGLPLGTRGGMLVTHTFPLDAVYTFQPRLLETQVNRLIGLEYPHTLVVTIDGEEVHRATIGGKDELAKSFQNPTAFIEAIAPRLAFRTSVKAGPHHVGISFIQKSEAIRQTVLEPFQRSRDVQDYTGIPYVRSLTIAGPIDPTGPGDTPSRRRIFVCRPASPEDEAPCAARILSTVAKRAYRRPLTAADTKVIEDFFRQGRTKPGGTFDSGIAMGLRRILTSPSFVLRMERDPIGAEPGSVHRLSDLELASRLSFFLWSSGPDDALLDLAEQGRLNRPDVLEQQVRRMLADPKSQALIDNFFGQWLYLRNLRNLTPDSREFPDFNGNLRRAMLEEMNLFLGSIIAEDRNVMDLLDASDTFVSERLAKHYGIPGIYGDQMRHITSVPDERRGLFGKGAILMVTSLATRTAPVLRGKWILENVFGTPPPPPPPNVPALMENGAGDRPRTLRARMEAHRANPVCASCHRVMDPLGFSLENFDAIGQWRTQDAGSPIDANGQLMNGDKVDGPVSLRRAVVSDPEVFLRTMTEKMMTYALGRGLDPRDMPTVRRITAAAAKQNYRFSSIVLGIVTSVPFQMRETPAPEREVAMADVR